MTQLNTELLEQILKAFNENNSQLEVIRSNSKVGAIISSCSDMEPEAWTHGVILFLGQDTICAAGVGVGKLRS